MALTVEDGTGLANADAYISVAFATQYHKDFGNTAWGNIASNSLREIAIREATLFIDICYEDQFKGERLRNDPDGPVVQALQWPRDRVQLNQDGFLLPVSPLPLELRRATAEVALLSATTGLYPAGDTQARESETLRAGRFSKTINFGSTATVFDTPQMRKAAMLLRPLLAIEMATPLVRT